MALLNNTFKSGLLFLGLVCILYGRSDVWGKMGRFEKMLHRSFQRTDTWNRGYEPQQTPGGEYDSDY